MNAVDLLRRASDHGLTLSVRGDNRIIVRGRPEAVEELKSELMAHKPELLAALRERVAATEPALTDQRLLRDCRWIAAFPVCDFLIGHSGENCRRCGASWREHYPAPE